MRLIYALLSFVTCMAYSPAYAVEEYVGLGLGQSEINQGFSENMATDTKYLVGCACIHTWPSKPRTLILGNRVKTCLA